MLYYISCIEKKNPLKDLAGDDSLLYDKKLNMTSKCALLAQETKSNLV